MRKIFKHYLLSGAALCSLLAVFSSCEEKDYTSRMPVFAGFVLNMDAPAPGDSIVITAKQATQGTLLNGTVYQWTITDSRDSTVYTAKQEVIYDHQPSDPVIGYRIPNNARTGRYTVSFYAKYKYSGKGDVLTGGSYDQGGEGISGSITPSTSGATYGECKGKVYFNVVK